ncbi:MAG: hypothetical protein A2161_15140 [Candidatus Schekmanbacteria bacterium RBG_13_48_7]|uniref:Uncharacterized protein n=1 Tax=Candidatus Schekmanbacteria bacterium RBG_13_48_7 TaxID=1817878 RepID=A0A1F7RW79_9BACT|nr:MAG: hypothetical protein A2161_15140 [Candidatus Schekmanbacteria bacterium RBG_13_48_7]
MSLKLCEIIKRIDTIEIAGMDETHEHVTDIGTMFRFVKVDVFSVGYSHFQSSFNNVGVRRRTGNFKKLSERIPEFDRVSDCFTRAGIGFDLFCINLFRKP